MRAALTLAALVTLAAVGGARAHAPAAPSQPDEVALRYYATQKQPERVEAEIRRLRRGFPNWQPPADLWTAEPAGADEEPYWALLNAGRFVDLRATLAARARTEPAWRPSRTLADALGRRELRIEALALAKATRWVDLARLGDRRRPEIDGADPELGWAVAEAMGRTERAPEAFALMRRVVEFPTATPEQRRVTVLRAMAFLPMADAERLAALCRAGDLDTIRIDRIRGRMSAVLHDEADIAVAADDLATFESYAEASQDANQPGLVAWYAFNRRDYPTALTWFKRAIAHGGDAMVAHGLAHTLRRLGLRREAEDVAYAWREPLVNNALLFIDLLEADLTKAVPPAIEPERLLRYAQVTAATASGEGAQALAWYAYNTCQFDTALTWFQRAMAWFPKEATAYGYALTLRRTHRQREFVEVVNRYDGLFPKVVDLLFQPPSDNPMPCEVQAARPAATPAPASAYLNLSALPSATSGQAAPSRTGYVPQPDELGGSAAAAPPTIRRNEFPIAVLMENDLRAAPTGVERRGGELRWPTRAIGRPSTIARRVPGVGPMPYERFGFSLLPAWNGTDAPSRPSAADRPAPLGSLWSDEQTRAIPAAATVPAAPSRPGTGSAAARGTPPGAALDVGRTGSIRPGADARPISASLLAPIRRLVP